MKKSIAVLLAAVMLIGLAACGGTTPSSSTPAAPATKPDVLTGSAKGFGGVVTVTVTVEDGVITDVAAVGADETTGIGTKALEELPAKIVEANGTGVDVIASATVTSKAIIYAVNNALDPAAYPYPPAEVDAVVQASPKEDSNPDVMIKALSKDGFWIFSVLADVTTDREIVVDGTFYDKDDGKTVFRKLALYAQDANRNVTAEYVLTTPRMTVNSPNFRIQNGTVKGNIFVAGEGFELRDTTLEGNLVFATEAAKASAKIETATVTGTVTVGSSVDAIAHASPKEGTNPDALVKAMSKDGSWIFSILGDVTVDKEIVVDGTFYDKDDGKTVFRKLALYAQDSARNVTADYTLVAPKMTVNSPNFRVQGGVLKADVYVTAEGFSLRTTIEGNLTFATQAAKDSADLEKGKVTGTVSVG